MSWVSHLRKKSCTAWVLIQAFCYHCCIVRNYVEDFTLCHECCYWVLGGYCTYDSIVQTSICKILAGAAHLVVVNWAGKKRNLSAYAFLVFYARLQRRRWGGEVALGTLCTNSVHLWRTLRKQQCIWGHYNVLKYGCGSVEPKWSRVFQQRFHALRGFLL